MPRYRRLLGFALIAMAAVVWPILGGAARGAPPTPVPLWETGTFSILGYDPATGEVGGTVQSSVFSVGNRNIWAQADVGAVVTQATVDVSYGPKSLELLKKGMAPAAIKGTLSEVLAAADAYPISLPSVMATSTQIVSAEVPKPLDYRLQPGVVQHSNALALMRAVGLEV